MYFILAIFLLYQSLFQLKHLSYRGTIFFISLSKRFCLKIAIPDSHPVLMVMPLGRVWIHNALIIKEHCLHHYFGKRNCTTFWGCFHLSELRFVSEWWSNVHSSHYSISRNSFPSLISMQKYQSCSKSLLLVFVNNWDIHRAQIFLLASIRCLTRFNIDIRCHRWQSSLLIIVILE